MVAAAPLPTDDELARLNLFRSVDVATVRPHLRGCSVRSLRADEILIQADQPNDSLYLLLSGTVSIHLRYPDNPPIVVLGAGETIGELSLIDKQPTSAFAVTQTACRVLVLNESVMWDLVQSSHAIALNLLGTLSHRLRYDNRLIYQDREQLRCRVHELETEREALQHSEQRYQALYDLNPTMVFTVDHLGRVVSTNQTGAAELGYQATELTGQPVSRFYLPEDRSYAEGQIGRCVAEPGSIHRWEARKVRKDGTQLWVRETARAILGKPRQPSVLVVSEDITESRRRSEQLAYHANHDALTGLVNRRAFEERLELALAVARAEQVEYALCYLDLDQFKVINDSCGHVAGDAFLRQLGRALQGVVSKRDTLARLGGDEFGVLLERCQVDQAKRVAYAVLDAVDNLCLAWDGRRFRVGISIGLVPINQDSESVESVLRAADAACYAAKEAGRNRIHVYNQADPGPVRHTHIDWIDRINHSLEHGCFQLSYQPIVALGQDSPGEKCFEVLLRMKGNHDAEVMPDVFLPIAERFNLSTKIDYWVVTNLLEMFARARSRVAQVDWCAINISAPSINDQDFIEFLIKQLKISALPPERICFDLAETAALSNVGAVRNFVDSLRGLGCRFAIDDFGDGWSSLAQLKHLPFDYVKVGSHFTKGMLGSAVDFALVKAVSEIAHAMRSKTVIEAVESAEILAALRDPTLGIDYVQGYAIQRPRPLAELF
jgi:diguanylate cyclase (GGDEF)-like protein/PAS domain S-box-containing protein